MSLNKEDKIIMRMTIGSSRVEPYGSISCQQFLRRAILNFPAYLSIHTCLSLYQFNNIYIYIYIERERERPSRLTSTSLITEFAISIISSSSVIVFLVIKLDSNKDLYIYIWIYIYIYLYNTSADVLGYNPIFIISFKMSTVRTPRIFESERGVTFCGKMTSTGRLLLDRSACSLYDNKSK